MRPATATATATATESVSAPAPAPATPARISSIDIIRGAVMILMAIDHVRVFSGVPAGGPTAGVFFTRWVTNFVAPAFIFFAGTAAYLHGARLASRSALARFLLTRGIWLVLLELTVIRMSWTFNLDFQTYLLAGVIWVIGWCMMLLAGLVFLPTIAVGTFGVLLIASHNLLGGLNPDGAGPLAQVLYFGGGIKLAEGPVLVVLYTIVPWLGVMAAGYAFGAVMKLPAERRRGITLRIGLAATALFVVLRFLDVYGDWSWRGGDGDMPAAFRFLATSKYPASLLFLLMTLGPTLIALALSERARGKVTDILATFGRVPLFYYLLHIPLIHLLALGVSALREGAVNSWLFTNHPMMNPEPPPGYTWSLTLLYLITIVAVVLLYFPCRWFAT